MFVRKECWTLSRRGKFLFLGLAVVVGLTLRWGAYPFLAVSRPLSADVLVVDSWNPYQLSKEIAAEFDSGQYRMLQNTCGRYGEVPPRVVNGKSVDLVSSWLINYGVPPESVHAVRCSEVARNRTYQSALEASLWLLNNETSPKARTLVTVGPHARRSWLTYRKVFDNTAAIGVIALTDPSYDPEHWWRFTEGMEEIAEEGAAYVHAQLFFIWN